MTWISPTSNQVFLELLLKSPPKIIAEVLGIPLVQAPSVSDLEITSDLLDRVSIDLWGEVRGQLG